MILDSPKISVIIPIYNIENYLNKCLSSIANQSLQNSLYEVILIDDCSTDNSHDILTKFQKKYGNFKIILNKKRKGIGPSRNVGIAASKGDYLFFIDGDDFIEKETLEVLLSTAEKEKSDIVTSGFHRITKNGEIRFSKNDYLLMATDKEEMLCEFFSNQLSSTAWGKLYNKELFINNNIKYPKGIHEDIGVTFKLFWFANKISRIDQYFYYWVERDASTTALMTKNHISGWFNAISIQKAFVSKNKEILTKQKLLSAVNQGFLVASNLLLERIKKIESEDIESRKSLYDYLFKKIKSFPSSKLIITSNEDKYLDLNRFYKIYCNNYNKYKAMIIYESNLQ
jgi:CDP-glycerol glycerophosphotransferase